MRPPRAAPPWWIGLGATAIRRLPAGRYRAAAALARTAPSPFIARLPAALGGARFSCDLGDEIARDAALTGSYEPQISWVFQRALGPGMVFVDAGANWGYFSLLAASRVGPGGVVLALEPDPRMFAQLAANFDLNGFGHARARPFAASSADGVVTLEGYAEGSSNRGISRISDAGAGLKVRAVALDGLLAAERIDAVDAIKIDVEGAEALVIAGMPDGLRAQRYARIFIELHPGLLAERGVTPDDCCAPLLGGGGRVCDADDERSVRPRVSGGGRREPAGHRHAAQRRAGDRRRRGDRASRPARRPRRAGDRDGTAHRLVRVA